MQSLRGGDDDLEGVLYGSIGCGGLGDDDDDDDDKDFCFDLGRLLSGAELDLSLPWEDKDGGFIFPGGDLMADGSARLGPPREQRVLGDDGGVEGRSAGRRSRGSGFMRHTRSQARREAAALGAAVSRGMAAPGHIKQGQLQQIYAQASGEGSDAGCQHMCTMYKWRG